MYIQDKKQTNNLHVPVLVGAFLISFFLKGVLLFDAPAVNRDAMVYIAAAQKFSAGQYAEMVQHYPMPLYPILLAGMHTAFPDWILAGRLLSTLPLILCLIPVYLLSSHLFGRSSAAFAALLFAVLPVFNTPSVEVIRDPSFLLCFLSSLAFFAEYHCKGSRVALYGALVFAVLSALLRIEGILLLALLPALHIWHVRYQFRLRLILYSIFLVFAPFVLLGLALWLFSQFGLESWSRIPEVFAWLKGIFTLNLFDNYLALQQLLKEFEQQTPGADLRNNLIETARHYAPLLYVIGLVEILIKEIFPVSLLALWAVYIRRKTNRRTFFVQHNVMYKNLPASFVQWPWLLFLLLNLLFCMAFNFTTTRYMWIPIVLLLPVTGYGIDLWRFRLAGRKLLMFVMMGMFFLGPALKTVAEVQFDRESVREAGQWLQNYDPRKQKKVAFNDRRLMLYASRFDSVYIGDICEIISPENRIIPEADMLMLDLGGRKFESESFPEWREKARFTDQHTTVVILEKKR